MGLRRLQGPGEGNSGWNCGAQLSPSTPTLRSADRSAAPLRLGRDANGTDVSMPAREAGRHGHEDRAAPLRSAQGADEEGDADGPADEGDEVDDAGGADGDEHDGLPRAGGGIPDGETKTPTIRVKEVGVSVLNR